MKIKIKEPCDADWSKMKIGMISRHCELCVKNVMDFTKMSREEILIYLFKNNTESTCARMYGGQMDFRHQELEAIIEGTRKQKGNLPFVVMSLAALALLSCDPSPIMGEVEHIPPSEILKELDSLKQKKDSVSIPTGIELGKMMIEEPLKPNCSPKAVEVEVEVEGMVDVFMGDVIETGEIEAIEQPEPPEMGGMISLPYEKLENDQIVSIRENAIYSIVEVMPEFVGGMDSLMTYLSKEIKYPKKSEKKGVEGRVFVQFVVEKDGSITQAKILRGLDESIDKEALRVIWEMPNWIAGENNGEKVRVNYTLPIKFVLK